MNRAIELWRGYLFVSLRNTVEFRTDWLIGLVSTPVLVYLSFSLWRWISPNQLQSVYLYVAAVFWIGYLGSASISDRISSDIQSGNLSQALCRPTHYLIEICAQVVSCVITLLLFSAVPAVLLLYGLDLPIQNLLPLFLSVIIAITIWYLIDLCIGLLAFWFDSISGIRFFLMTALSVVGGRVIPLQFFPEHLAKWFRLGPLASVFDAPATIASTAGPSLFWAISTQLAWLIIMALLAYLLWQKGLPRYEARGG